MDKFVRSFITQWRKLGLPFTGETIVVAVSGGADSMSLLVAIHDLAKRKKLTHRVIVAHFNHKLRGRESDKDERYVGQEAERLGFEFAAGSAGAAKKGNLEQMARDARYKFLSKTADKNNAFAVLTAHTQNDQA
ncbi:MAG: tRNA lysidine(34) synthetase, partial [Acidobacteriota bacterium]